MNPACVRTRLAFGASWILWPSLLTASIAFVATAPSIDAQKLRFLLAYAALLLALGLLERVWPHERQWWDDDGQLWADLGHTATLKGTSFVISFLVVDAGRAVAAPVASGPWPGSWPMALQVTLGLVIAEFGLYWHHRLAHEWPRLWHFHAVHHSVTRLWFVNTGRFHFGDSLVSLVLSNPLLYLAGAPQQVLLWIGYITMFLGVLTHCNVEMRFGALSQLFNTPELHRFHHSRRPEEGNRNYGENLMLWDHLFGTFFRTDRRPPLDIGIQESMPAGFGAQLLYPFRAQRRV